MEVVVAGELTDELEAKIIKAVPRQERTSVRATIAHFRQRQRPPSPSEKRQSFTVPQLCLWVDGEWEMVDEEWFFGEGGWSLLGFPPQLTEGEFSIRREANQYEIFKIAKNSQNNVII